MRFSLLAGGFRRLMALLFTAIFFVLSITLAVLTVQAIAQGFFGDLKLIDAFLKAVNMAVISLATFELGLVVSKEYAGRDDEGHIATVLQRTLPRFISIVCIALALEGLLMVIKYSQLELAGNLYYPVAIIASTALLLAALGLFLRLSGACGQEAAKPEEVTLKPAVPVRASA
jgi:asparagine N-glycosylation enzyme membrane subunit Stt3